LKIALAFDFTATPRNPIFDACEQVLRNTKLQ
jgi:hypothetical protein